MFRFQITPRPSWLRPPRCGSVFHARTSDRKSTRLNSSHSQISYAVFCLKKKKADAITLAVASGLPTETASLGMARLLAGAVHNLPDLAPLIELSGPAARRGPRQIDAHLL